MVEAAGDWLSDSERQEAGFWVRKMFRRKTSQWWQQYGGWYEQQQTSSSGWAPVEEHRKPVFELGPSPRARGWSRRGGALGAQDGVLPARAGMVPPRHFRATVCPIKPWLRHAGGTL